MKPQGNDSMKIIPYIDARIATGFPSPANDYLEKPIDLNEAFVKHPLSTFLVSTQGDSMDAAFIPHRSKLLVDKSVTPRNGDIVVAVCNGEFTVKFLELTSRSCRLVPANSKYEAVEITGDTQFQVWGVVVMIFIDPKDVQDVCPGRL